MNDKLPNYDPRKGGQTSLSFGTEPTDYRKKDEVFTSVKVKNPPGGKSNIMFGWGKQRILKDVIMFQSVFKLYSFDGIRGNLLFNN